MSRILPSYYKYGSNLDNVPHILNDDDINDLLNSYPLDQNNTSHKLNDNEINDLINNYPLDLNDSDSEAEQLTESEEDNLSDLEVDSDSDDYDLTPEPGISKYIEHKPDSSYPKTIKDEIRLLSVSLDQPAVPFGSAIYRIQQFPGDVDLIENITACCTGTRVFDRFIKAMKRVVNRVIKTKLHYYSEIKAGIDTRYNVNVGTLENGHYTRGELLIPQLKNLYRKGLISKLDLTIIAKVINGTTANDYDIIYNIIRKYYILRWTAKEFLAGKKQLLKKTITLKNASFEKDSLFKIDEITLIQGKFAEVTNAYYLQTHNPKINNILHLTVGNSDFALMDGLQKEVEKLYYSDMFYNPFKVIKRMFAMAQTPLNKNTSLWQNLLEKLIPFISSTTSLLYQIKSELDSILTIMEKSKSIPKATINKQIDEMKFRLANFVNIPYHELLKINDLIDSITSNNDLDYKIEHIEKLIIILKKYINHETIIYMNSVNINPPPAFTMPSYHKYDRLKVRLPESDPIDPLIFIENNMSTGSGMEQNDIATSLVNQIRMTNRLQHLFNR